MSKKASIEAFNRMLERFYASHGRAHLPWRASRDPWAVLVSEVMLQQTQASRVVPFFEAFIAVFPDAAALSLAPLSKVLRLWRGLGYNRRAKWLRDAALMLEQEFGGTFPRHVADIERLPGVGPYSARAVAAFAFNRPEVFIETNIRTVFLHHCFQNIKVTPCLARCHLDKISDSEILPLIREALAHSHLEPRDFYAALMDYGAHLKKSGVLLNGRSKHYARQTKFEGSRRQLRGRILKLLLEKPQTLRTVLRRSARPAADVREELARLQKEELIVFRENRFSIFN